MENRLMDMGGEGGGEGRMGRMARAAWKQVPAVRGTVSQ